jgi:hypothetical protein
VGEEGEVSRVEDGEEGPEPVDDARVAGGLLQDPAGGRQPEDDTEGRVQGLVGSVPAGDVVPRSLERGLRDKVLGRIERPLVGPGLDGGQGKTEAVAVLEEALETRQQVLRHVQCRMRAREHLSPLLSLT